MATSSNPTVTRRLNKVLETPVDNPDSVLALQNLSTFYGKNSLAARRNLRGQIEKRGVEINEEFLNIFLNVQKVNIIVFIQNHNSIRTLSFTYSYSIWTMCKKM